MKPTYVTHKIAKCINISKIVTIHYFEFDKNFKFNGESHDFWEMVYVDKGEVIVTARNKEYKLKQGEVIFHKPNEFHTIRADDKIAPNVFIISFGTISKAMDFFKNKTTSIPSKLKHYITSIIEEGRQTFDLPSNNPALCELKVKTSAPIGGQQLIKTYLEQLLIMMIRLEDIKKETKIFPSRESMENHLIASIMEELEKNIRNKISVEELCRNLNYSKTYLSKLFKKNCGYTLVEYYSILKITEAKKLIREKNHNFAQISVILSFDNPQYFSRVFKRVSGMTPREYMHSVRID